MLDPSLPSQFLPPPSGLLIGSPIWPMTGKKGRVLPMIVALDIDDIITRHPEFFAFISNSLMDAGHHVMVITMRDDRALTEETLQNWGIAYHELFCWSMESCDLAKTDQWKAEVCRRHQVDVLFEDDPDILAHVDGSTTCFLPFGIPSKCRRWGMTDAEEAQTVHLGFKRLLRPGGLESFTFDPYDGHLHEHCDRCGWDNEASSSDTLHCPQCGTALMGCRTLRLGGLEVASRDPKRGFHLRDRSGGEVRIDGADVPDVLTFMIQNALW